MRTTVSTVLLALALSTLGTATATAQDLRIEIEQVTAQLQAAGAANLNLIAPQAYTKARQKITEAESIYQRGANPKEVRKKLDEARIELARAESLQEMGMILLGSALTARTDALVVNAPATKEAEKDWRDGEKALQKAGRKVESGDRNGAVQEASKAEAAYREAEYEALRKVIVSTTEALRKTAKDRGADKKAATTFLKADTELAAAEQALRANRKDQSEAITHAITSADGYRRASRIALMVDAVKRNPNATVEKLVLDYEGYMSDAALSLNFTADFHEGPQPVSTQLIDAITSLTEDRDALRTEASDAGLALAELRAEHDFLVFTSDSLAARLTMQADSLAAQRQLQQAEQRRMATQLRARQEREARIQAVGELFTEDEAQVAMIGNDLVIRMYGLNFPVGLAQIRPESFGLLTKLQKVLREFPTDPIEIAGHTDSQGNAQRNQALSERRASAVRQYLIANMAIPEIQISAVGYGESQPLASNESPAGRAKNRRIDVRIVLPEL